MRSIVVFALSAFVVQAYANEAPTANRDDELTQDEMNEIVEQLGDEKTMNMFVDRFIDKLTSTLFSVAPMVPQQYLAPPAIVQSAPTSSQRDLFSARSDPPVAFVKYELPSKLRTDKANTGISEENYNSLPGEKGVFNGKWGIPVDGNGRRIENIYPDAVDAAKAIDLNERNTASGTENMVKRDIIAQKGIYAPIEKTYFKPIDKDLLFGTDNYDRLDNIGKDPTYYKLFEEPELISTSNVALIGLLVVGGFALAVVHLRRKARTVTQHPLFGA